MAAELELRAEVDRAADVRLREDMDADAAFSVRTVLGGRVAEHRRQADVDQAAGVAVPGAEHCIPIEVPLPLLKPVRLDVPLQAEAPHIDLPRAGTDLHGDAVERVGRAGGKKKKYRCENFFHLL